MAEIRVLTRNKSLDNINGPPQIFEEIVEIIKSDEPAWIDITHQDETLVNQFNHVFPIHPVTIEDLIVPTREKREKFNTYSFYSINETDEKYLHAQLKIIIHGNQIYTFHNNPKLNCIISVIKRFINQNNDIQYDPHWIAYALIDEICNIYIDLVRRIVANTQTLDELALTLDHRDHNNDLLSRIANARRNLSNLRGSLWAKQEILREIIKNTPDSKEQLDAYLRDVSDHVIRMLDKLSVSTDQLNHIGNIYLTRISIELGKHSEEMNQTINRFSAVATIFLPLSVLTGLWGMNVQVPGQYDANITESQIYPFYIIAGCLLLFSILLGGYFRKRRWL